MIFFLKIATFFHQTISHHFKYRNIASAAALAYYTLFALAPLLLILLTIFGTFISDPSIRIDLLNQLSKSIDPSISQLVIHILENVENQQKIGIARIVGIVVLTFAVGNLIGYLHQSLNSIFETNTSKKGVAKVVQIHLFSWFLMIFFGFLWVLSLIFEIIVQWISQRWINIPNLLVEFGGFILVVVFLTALFRVLVIQKIEWKNLILGAFFTGIVLRIARLFFNWYLATSDLASAYGAAASLIAFLVWLYISAQVLFLGASFIYTLQKNTQQ